jgi:hypothetical protein
MAKKKTERRAGGFARGAAIRKPFIDWKWKFL